MSWCSMPLAVCKESAFLIEDIKQSKQLPVQLQLDSLGAGHAGCWC